MTKVEHETEGYVLQPGQGRTIPVPHAGSVVTMKAENQRTGGLISLYESTLEPDSMGPARHYHEERTEVFYILEGTLILLVGDETHRAPAGTTAVVPPRAVHAFQNAANEPARLLVMVLPGGVEGYFDAVSELPSPTSAPEQWQQIYETWDVHVVGPPLGLPDP